MGVGAAMLVAAGVLAAHDHPATPYAGQEARAIKALDPEHVAGLLAGRGLGYAKAAELNRYPGPAHVIELAGPLGLTDAQLAATRAIHQRMEARAKDLGARLVDAEAALDALFRDGVATPEASAAALDTIAGLQARLRGVHLDAHIEQRAVLTPEQVERYVQLRGYDGGKGTAAPDHGHLGHEGHQWHQGHQGHEGHEGHEAHHGH